MKRRSKKTDLTADRCLQKEGNTAPKPATKGWKNMPLLIERFRRLWKTLKTWNSFENRGGKISKRAVSNYSKLQAGKRLTRQLSMRMVFNTLLSRHFPFFMAPSGYFSLERTTDLVFSEPCSKILSPVEKSRRNLSEEPGISTMSKAFTPPFFTLIRVFIPVFNNL